MIKPDEVLTGWTQGETETWICLGSLHSEDTPFHEIHNAVHLLCPVIINNSSYSAILDTGATRSLIGFHYQLTPNNVILIDETYVSANGGIIRSNQLVSTTLSCGNTQMEIEIRQVDIRIPLILGLDWLNKFKCKLDFTNPGLPLLELPSGECVKLKQPTHEILFPLKSLTEKRTVMAVHNINQQKIPSGYVCFLQCGSNPPPTNALVGWFTGNKTALFSPPSLLPLSQQFIIGVVNTSAKPIFIQPNQIIGKVYWSHRPITIGTSPSVLSIHTGIETETQMDLNPNDHFDLSEVKTRVSPEDFQRVEFLLRQYQSVWDPTQSLRATNLVEMDIDLVDNKPFYLSPYNTSPDGRNYVAKAVADMEKDGVVRKSNSPWGSPILLVPKPDGTWRFCIDFRRLNRNTVTDAYPLPRMDDILQRAGGHNWYTALDERSGYWQIKMNKQDIPKTAFVTPDGHYEWVRMPFGLVNAPAIFQRLTDALLIGIKWQYCAGYIDDIIIWSNTFSDHLQHVEEVFRRMQQANLQLRPKKCDLFRSSVKCLGSIINAQGISMDPKRIAALKDLPIPTSKDSLRSALGTLGYYQKFIDGYAVIANPLTRMTREKEPFFWTKEAQASYDELKRTISKNAILAVPQADIPFLLDTDACAEGISAILSQEINGIERPIAFLSRKLRDLEQRTHPQVEREVLAIVWAIDKLQHFLVKPFTLRSDCRSLSWIYGQTKGRLGRWAALLSGYQFTFIHRAGKKHGNVDGLSRLPLDSQGPNLSLEHFADGVACTVTTKDFILTDEVLNEHWHKDTKIQEFFEGNTTLERRRQRFYKKGSNLIYIPATLRNSLLQQSHDDYGAHCGRNKTYSRINSQFWWPQMKHDIEEYVNTCLICKQVKAGKERQQGLMEPIRVKRPWDILGIDIFGPLPMTDRGNRFIIVMIDHATKFVLAEPTNNIVSETIIDFLDKHFNMFGYPQALLSDRGPQFTSWITREYCKFKNISKLFTTAYHPQGDGVAEAFMKFLGNGLRTLALESPSKWDCNINKIAWSHRTSLHPSIGDTPFHALFGRDPGDPFQHLTREIIDWTFREAQNQIEHTDYIQKVHNKIIETFTTAQDKVLQNRNLNRQQFIINIGDLILKRNMMPHKLEPRWSEPYRVTESYWNGKVLQIRHTLSGKEETVNVENLRKISVRLSEEEKDQFIQELSKDISECGVNQSSLSSEEENDVELPSSRSRTKEIVHLEEDSIDFEDQSKRIEHRIPIQIESIPETHEESVESNSIDIFMRTPSDSLSPPNPVVISPPDSSNPGNPIVISPSDSSNTHVEENIDQLDHISIQDTITDTSTTLDSEVISEEGELIETPRCHRVRPDKDYNYGDPVHY